MLSVNRRWKVIFKYIADHRIHSQYRSVWYTAIHGKINHNELFYKQRRRDSPLCDRCPGVIDTVEHKLFSCLVSKPVWIFVKSIISRMKPALQRKSPNYFLFPELRGIPSREALKINQLFAKFVYFICCTPEEQINVSSFKLEL